MAAITSANVTLVRTWEEGDRTDKFVQIIGVYDVVLSSQGGTAGDIPATAFGLSKIFWAICVRAVDGSSNLATVTPIVEVGDTGILISDPETATDANRGNIVNYTGTVRLHLGGRH